MVGDVMPPQVPLVLHFLLADLTGQLPADGVHVEDVLLQVELVAEHPLAVLTHAGLAALPGGAQQSGHLRLGGVSGNILDIRTDQILVWKQVARRYRVVAASVVHAIASCTLPTYATSGVINAFFGAFN